MFYQTHATSLQSVDSISISSSKLWAGALFLSGNVSRQYFKCKLKYFISGEPTLICRKERVGSTQVGYGHPARTGPRTAGRLRRRGDDHNLDNNRTATEAASAGQTHLRIIPEQPLGLCMVSAGRENYLGLLTSAEGSDWPLRWLSATDRSQAEDDKSGVTLS